MLTLTATATAGHGVNIGHGFVKYVIAGADGAERLPLVFPAMIARAGKSVSGALARAESVTMGDDFWWTGDDALLSSSPLTFLGQERLADDVFIPALLRGALQRLGQLQGAGGVCVTGLPATWINEERSHALGERIRAAQPGYRSIYVIPEPLGLVYAALLDGNGQIMGDLALTAGRVGIIDLGHHTDDICVVDQMRPIDASMATFQTGTARPLAQIARHLSAAYERELTLSEADAAVRARQVKIAGAPRPLPEGWAEPLVENGEALARRLVERWGRGSDLDTILIGGGGAELPQKVHAIQRRFPHARVVDQPQTAIARGYARLARRRAAGGR